MNISPEHLFRMRRLEKRLKRILEDVYDDGYEHEDSVGGLDVTYSIWRDFVLTISDFLTFIDSVEDKNAGRSA